MKNECTILLTAMKNWDLVDGFFVSHSVDSQQIKPISFVFFLCM